MKCFLKTLFVLPVLLVLMAVSLPWILAFLAGCFDDEKKFPVVLVMDWYVQV